MTKADEDDPSPIRTRSAAQRSVEHARRLGVFLRNLDPLQRAYVLGNTSDPALQSEFFTVSVQRDREYARLLDTYYRLVIQVPDEWRRVCRRLTPGQAKMLELSLLGRHRGRGAPTLPHAERADVHLAQAVSAAAARLAAGVKIRLDHRRRGGFYSDDDTIRAELIKCKYTGNELKAILRAKTAIGAAQHLVALDSGGRWSAASVRAAASRGRRYLQRPRKGIER